jgi:hypothetical protein
VMWSIFFGLNNFSPFVIEHKKQRQFVWHFQQDYDNLRI